MNVCLGGTFDLFHKGHMVLLKKAFQVAGPNGFVFIGITSDSIAKKKGGIHSFTERKQTIEQFLSKEGKNQRYSIKVLNDQFGPSIEEDFDAIVVSQETKQTTKEINKKRKNLGKKPLQIVVIPFVLADDSKPISSSRIRKKEIDAQGALLRKE
jgi:pantetheine-phosphate adenylyltransferase